MVGLGTLVNSLAVIGGGAVGVFIKNGLPERFKTIIMQGIGLAVVAIGISGNIQGIFHIDIKAGGTIYRQYIMTMIFSLVIGALLGEWINIDNKLERLGDRLQKRFAGGEGSFSEGFVTASLVYCVGAMAIVGSLEDGLRGNPGILFAKSILDGVSAIVFASTLGAGVIFSAASVLIYQGLITLLAGFIKPWLTDVVITQMSLTGSVLILAIGMNMLGMQKIKVANLLPAIFMPLAYYILSTLVGMVV